MQGGRRVKAVKILNWLQNFGYGEPQAGGIGKRLTDQGCDGQAP